VEELRTITINLSSVKKELLLHIDARRPHSLYKNQILGNDEPHVQLLEGCFYDYEFNDKEFSFNRDVIVLPHPRNSHLGTITTNIYVGTLSLSIYHSGQEVGQVELEVQSVKSDYQKDYRDMLEYITDKCTDLLFKASSPVSQKFEVDPKGDSRTLYQKFAFINSVVGTVDFQEAVHRIIASPATEWKEKKELQSSTKIRRLYRTQLRELIGGKKRLDLPMGHSLRSYGLNSVPDKLFLKQKKETVDTYENRFIKYALQTYLKFSQDINDLAVEGSRLDKESHSLIIRLQSFLNHTFFKDISPPNFLRNNSPLLQRKEGYREIFRSWLMFDLAAKLAWKGGEDVYNGGKKDVAALYEYWLFFKLLELLNEVFKIKSKSVEKLIIKTKDGLHLELRQGFHTALSGTYDNGGRKLKIRFNYNRSFQGMQTYPKAGSWTTTMRPDYTLSIWPEEYTEHEAEMQELIVHIHFDAKYKVDNFSKLILNKSQVELDIEKTEMRQGVYKNADLLKMHAYKDAIRRTSGSYVLYPGDKTLVEKGFHEVIPGLGAFPISPSKFGDGSRILKNFLVEVVEHFQNKNSQREKFRKAEREIHNPD